MILTLEIQLEVGLPSNFGGAQGWLVERSLIEHLHLCATEAGWIRGGRRSTVRPPPS